MGRDIKFRGFSKEFNEMMSYETLKSASDGMVKISQKYLDDNKILSIPIQKGLFIPTEDLDMTLMQYTGLKDRNGKEIYEGDIVFDSHCEECGKVIFNEGCFAIGWEGTTEDLFENCDIYEVIGNVWENPELLEGDTE